MPTTIQRSVIFFLFAKCQVSGMSFISALSRLCLSYALASISCEHCRSSRNNPHYAPRHIIYYYVTSTHLQVFLRTLESNLVYNECYNGIGWNYEAYMIEGPPAITCRALEMAENNCSRTKYIAAKSAIINKCF